MSKLSPLSRYEQETAICFNEEEKDMEIFTYNAALQKHCESVLGLKPDKVNVSNGRTYTMPKKWFRLPRRTRTAPITAEQAEKRREQLAKVRQKMKQKP